jgi:hypothetical protein
MALFGARDSVAADTLAFSLSNDPTFPWMATSIISMLLCLVLATWMLYATSRWRTAFKAKEWMLLPDSAGTEIHSALKEMTASQKDSILKFSNVQVRSLQDFEPFVRRACTQAELAGAESTALRTEFSILRDELEAKSKEIKELQLGRDFHSRRSILLRVIKAFEAIDQDSSLGVDAARTLEGVRAELEECLEDNAIKVVKPIVGERISEAKLIDPRSAAKENAPDATLKGTVSAVERPAYVVRRLDGQEELLIPARVTVYV